MRNWIPGELVRSENEWLCRWLDTETLPFTDPFFHETLNKCHYLPVNSRRYQCVGSIPSLIEWADALPAVPPSAFIFHVSRCGSTLASQLLALDPDHIVLSEVPFIDDLLRLPYKNAAGPALPPLEQSVKAAIGFYGQQRTGRERRLFIKTDSWHISFYRQLREWYPGVPFILLYRSPDEVLYSQRRKRGMHAVPGVIEPAVLGLEEMPPLPTGPDNPAGPDNPEAPDHPTFLDGHMTKVLERYLARFLEIARTDRHALLVNYNEGIPSIVEKIAILTNTELSGTVREQMELRSRYHAKYPGQVFSEAGPSVDPPFYLARAMQLYRQLDRERNHMAENKPG